MNEEAEELEKPRLFSFKWFCKKISWLPKTKRELKLWALSWNFSTVWTLTQITVGSLIWKALPVGLTSALKTIGTKIAALFATIFNVAFHSA